MGDDNVIEEGTNTSVTQTRYSQKYQFFFQILYSKNRVSTALQDVGGHTFVDELFSHDFFLS